MSFFYYIQFQLYLGGMLADKVGTRVVIAGMVILWSLVQFSTIFVSSFAFLLITRIILGAGEGPSYSLAMTAASKWLPKEKRGIGISLVSIGGPLGVAISAPILMNMINNLWLAFSFCCHWNHWGYLGSCMALDCKREKGINRRINSP